MKADVVPVDAAGATVGWLVPKVNVDVEVALVVEFEEPNVKLFEDAIDVEVGVAEAGLLVAPKPPKVGALSDFAAPKANPELAGAIFDPSVAAAGTAAGLAAAPKVNVDEVLDSVVAVGADAPKENVDGNVGAVVAGVDVVGLIDSEIEKKRFVIAKHKLNNQMRFQSPNKVFSKNCSLIKLIPN